MEDNGHTMKMTEPARPRPTAKEGLMSLALLFGSATVVPAVVVAWVAAIRFIW